MRLALLIVALAAAAVAQASAATLHVSTNGAGHACSKTAPCNLTTAAEVADTRASASLLLAAGEYAGVEANVSAKLQALTVTGKGKVVLNGVADKPCLSFLHGGVLTLKGLTFAGCHGAVDVRGSLVAESCVFENSTATAVSVAVAGADKTQYTAELTKVTCRGSNNAACLALAATSTAKGANTLKATVTDFEATGNSGEAVVTVQGSGKNGAVLLDLTESRLRNNTARAVFVENAVADKNVWAVIISSCNITGNVVAGNTTGAGVLVHNSAVGVPETLLVRNHVTGGADAVKQVDLVKEQIDCDAKALKLGSCQNCGVDKKTGNFDESTVSAHGEASCSKCFKKHNSKFPSKAGSSKTGHIGRGCVQFVAQGTNKTEEHFAVCVDECPPPGEDLSFGAADVVGLAALGVATLAVFNCLVTTRSPEHYAKLRKEEEQSAGTAPLLDHAGSSAPIATGVATTYAEDVDPNGTVQSV